MEVCVLNFCTTQIQDWHYLVVTFKRKILRTIFEESDATTK